MKRPGRAAAVVGLAVLVVVAIVIAVVTRSTGDAPTNRRPSDRPPSTSRALADYVDRPGNQVVVVPDGTYRGNGRAALVPPSREHGGRFGGWLVLVAQSKGGAVVDLAGAELTLGPGDWRVAFVGFRFVNGTVNVWGSNVVFWYSDFSFPTDVWEQQRYYRNARPLDVNKDTSQNVRFYGVDVHDASTLLRAGTSQDVLVEGAHFFGSTATQLGHFDAISVRGGAKNFTLRDSEVEGRVLFTDGERGADPQAPVTGLDIEHVWLEKSPSAGIYFGSLPREAGKPEARGVFGRMRDVHIWDFNGDGRVEQIYLSGKLVSHFGEDANGRPERIEVTEDGVVYGPPPSDARSPALEWRDAHPYDSWSSYLQDVLR